MRRTGMRSDDCLNKELNRMIGISDVGCHYNDVLYNVHYCTVIITEWILLLVS